jgi:hypothetical protein
VKLRLVSGFWITLFCAFPVLTVSAAADSVIEPGQWKVTTNTLMNGATMPPQVKARCLTPEQAGDIGKTFGPTMGTVNSTCERTQYETAGRRLKWRLQCKGDLDTDVSGDFNFDSPVHYTASISSKGWMAGSLMSDVQTKLEGERVSECQQ